MDSAREHERVMPRTKPRPLARTGSRYAHYRKYMALYLISLPGIFFFLVFKYVPLFGSIMAFNDYDVFAGLWKSEWVGFAHFKRMFAGECGPANLRRISDREVEIEAGGGKTLAALTEEGLRIWPAAVPAER